MISLSILLIIFLGLVALVDFKFKIVPSMFLTGLILLATVIQYNHGIEFIVTGLIAFIFAYTLYEADFIGGIADIKFITIIGLMLASFNYVVLFILITLLFGFTYKLIYRFILNKNEDEEVPFIPCLYAVYLALFFIGGIF